MYAIRTTLVRSLFCLAIGEGPPKGRRRAPASQPATQAVDALTAKQQELVAEVVDAARPRYLRIVTEAEEAVEEVKDRPVRKGPAAKRHAKAKAADLARAEAELSKAESGAGLFARALANPAALEIGMFGEVPKNWCGPECQCVAGEIAGQDRLVLDLSWFDSTSHPGQRPIEHSCHPCFLAGYSTKGVVTGRAIYLVGKTLFVRTTAQYGRDTILVLQILDDEVIVAACKALKAEREKLKKDGEEG